MKKYICHHTYCGKTMENIDVTIDEHQILEKQNDILFWNNTPICIYRSLVGKKHFAINEDNNGYNRGLLTYEIAYSPRLNYGGPSNTYQQRFTDDEIQILNENYQNYLKPNLDVLLFNDEFFELPLEKLIEIANAINIKIPNLEKKDVSSY